MTPGPDYDWGKSSLRYLGILRSEMPAPEPEPSFEERVARCKEMGLIICTCSGVDRGGEHIMIYNLQCPIHGGKAGK